MTHYKDYVPSSSSLQVDVKGRVLASINIELRLFELTIVLLQPEIVLLWAVDSHRISPGTPVDARFHRRFVV